MKTLVLVFRTRRQSSYGRGRLLGILKLTVLEDAFQNSSIGSGEGTLSVGFVIPEFTDIFVPIGSG